MRLAAAAAVFAIPLIVSAQAPDAAPAPAEGGAAPPAEAPAPQPTAVPEIPTRRPTRPWLPTGTNTPSDTETPTAVPPTATATRPPPPTASATMLPPTSTATPLAGWMGFASPDGGLSAPLLLGLGGVIALLATALGARIAGARERLDRRRARRTLATAMLLELRRVDAVLRRVVGLDNPASFPSLDHPIMEAALRDLTLFQTPTAARIAQFHSALRGIQHEIGDYRDNPLRWAGRLGELNQLIKTRAAAACRAVPQLMKALEAEGGAAPPHLHEAPTRAPTDSKDLPPPPFGDTEGDDWTL